MAMYFVQHGKALSKEEDPDRPLSEDGREEVTAVAAKLGAMGVKVEAVCHSGKTRAEETAELFAEKIADGSVSKRDGMKATDDVGDFADDLDDNLMYVGHLPHMGKLVSLLTADDEDAGVVEYTNGGVVCVEEDEDGYHILWYLVPRMCTM